MSQPPANQRPPEWRRPPGVAPGTWQYVNQRSIADHYDDFVADTPLCELDNRIIHQTFPAFANNATDAQRANPPTVLDLGCGTGRTAIPLSKLGYEVIGVDLSRPMLDQLIAKTREQKSANIQAVQANLVCLDCFADNSVDHAVCMFSTLGMIQSRTNRRAMLRHASRIVRPGGTLVAHVHHRWAGLHERGGWAKLVSSFFKSLLNRGYEFGDATYEYRGVEKMFMHRFSRRELLQDFGQSGWDVESIQNVSLDGASITKSLFRAGGFMITAHASQD